MTVSTVILERESQLRLVEYAETHAPPANPMDVFLAGFWAAVDAMESPRTVVEIELALNVRRAVRAHLLKETS